MPPDIEIIDVPLPTRSGTIDKFDLFQRASTYPDIF